MKSNGTSSTVSIWLQAAIVAINALPAAISLIKGLRRKAEREEAFQRRRRIQALLNEASAVIDYKRQALQGWMTEQRAEEILRENAGGHYRVALQHWRGEFAAIPDTQDYAEQVAEATRRMYMEEASQFLFRTHAARIGLAAAALTGLGLGLYKWASD